MTQFHQEYQQVFGQQQNAGHDISNANQSLTFGAVQSPADLSTLLTQLQTAQARIEAFSPGEIINTGPIPYGVTCSAYQLP